MARPSKATHLLFSEAVIKCLPEADKKKWGKSEDPDYPDYFLFHRGSTIPAMKVSIYNDEKDPSKISVWLTAQSSPFEFMKFITRKVSILLSDLSDEMKIKTIIDGIYSLAAHQDVLFPQAIAKKQLDEMKTRKVYVERYLKLLTEILANIQKVTTVEAAIDIVSKRCLSIYNEQKSIGDHMQHCVASQISYTKEINSYKPFPTHGRKQFCMEQREILSMRWKELHLKMLSNDRLTTATLKLCEDVKKLDTLDKCIEYMKNAIDIVQKSQDDILQVIISLEKEIIVCTEKCDTLHSFKNNDINSIIGEIEKLSISKKQ